MVNPNRGSRAVHSSSLTELQDGHERTLHEGTSERIAEQVAASRVLGAREMEKVWMSVLVPSHTCEHIVVIVSHFFVEGNIIDPAGWWWG